MKKAFTLIELIVVVVIILVCGGILTLGFRSLIGSNQGEDRGLMENYERDFAAYAQRLYPGDTVQGVGCRAIPELGGSACTATVLRKSGQIETVSGECNYSGCGPVSYKR